MADGGSPVPARIPPDRVVHIDVFNSPRIDRGAAGSVEERMA